jgi:HPt (histidine-containing phosphotransfer) domain-containing protein
MGYSKPIAALTANAMPDEIKRCYDVGCDTFLSKPIELEEFHAVLKKYLGSAETSPDDSAITSSLIEEDHSFYEIVSDFVENLPNTLNKLKTIYHNEDWQTLHTEIHTLKGTGGNFGFDEITQICREIETNIDNQDYQAIAPLLDNLDALYSRILLGLQVA